MSSDTEPQQEEVSCFKCGQPVEMDNQDSFPEPLCWGCSNGQDTIDDMEGQR